MCGLSSSSARGSNSSGHLGICNEISLGQNRGDAPGEMGATLPAVDLGEGATVTAIGQGDSHTCALLVGGQVKCWGFSFEGALGQGSSEVIGCDNQKMGDHLAPVALGAAAQAISVGLDHTCALLVGGQVKCWGDNFLGKLGLGDKMSRGDQPGEMGDALPPVPLGSAAEP